VLDRDGHTCQLCGAGATVIDHVRPASEFEPDDPSVNDIGNLRASCTRCNYARMPRGVRVVGPIAHRYD
jgi:5-methylcytosine-specific restriction endonuclease McrA